MVYINRLDKHAYTRSRSAQNISDFRALPIQNVFRFALVIIDANYMLICSSIEMYWSLARRWLIVKMFIQLIPNCLCVVLCFVYVRWFIHIMLLLKFLHFQSAFQRAHNSKRFRCLLFHSHHNVLYGNDEKNIKSIAFDGGYFDQLQKYTTSNCSLRNLNCLHLVLILVMLRYYSGFYSHFMWREPNNGYNDFHSKVASRKSYFKQTDVISVSY